MPLRSFNQLFTFQIKIGMTTFRQNDAREETMNNLVAL